jgi:hypothetical protein
LGNSPAQTCGEGCWPSRPCLNGCCWRLEKAIWESAERADLRGSLRWLARNWARVAAWWLIVGLVLTALVVFASVVIWDSPKVVIGKVLGWGGQIIGSGMLGALSLSGGVLVVTLPITLPLALLVFG